MKASFHFGILIVLTMMMAWSSGAFCQAPYPSAANGIPGTGRSWGGSMGGTYSAAVGYGYNPGTEATLSGTVQRVREQGFAGTHVDLESGSNAFDVYVGPTSFLQSKGFTIAKGDHIEVTGSKIGSPDHVAIIAREVRKGDEVLTLRNAQGSPMWSGAMAPAPNPRAAH